MNILNIRVDDRLVHGCVATLWAPKLKVERIICIDDESANTPMLKNALRMATPRNIYLSVLTFDKALENLKVDRYQQERVMIVVKAPETILKLIEGGFPVSAVTLGNLGNINRTTDSVPISKYITVNDKDYKDIEALHNHQVELVAQLTPDDSCVKNFYEEMKRKVKG